MMHDHKERARRLGAEVVAAERPIVRRATGRCGDSCKWRGAHRLIAKLRAEHLNTHLLQTALLSTEQARRYTELRGYAVASTPRGHASGKDSQPSHHRKTR